MLIAVGTVIENWVSVCLEFGRSKKATISCGYPISAPTHQWKVMVHAASLCWGLVCAAWGWQHGVTTEAPWGAAPLTLQQPLLHREMWGITSVWLHSTTCTVCKLPCVEKRPWNNCCFPTTAVFPPRLHVLPAGKLTNWLLLLLMLNNHPPSASRLWLQWAAQAVSKIRGEWIGNCSL